MLKKNDISNLTEVNNTTYAAAAYISELAGANYLPKKKKGALVKKTVRGEIEGT